MEQLALQSLFFNDPHRVVQFPDKLLRNLSGNACEGSCTMATLLSSFVLLSHGAGARAAGLAPPRRMPSLAAGEDEGDELAALWA